MYKQISKIIIRMYELMCDQRYQKFIDPVFVQNNELGMYFKVQVSGNNFGYEKDGNTHHSDWECRSIRFLHIIIHKNHRVYVASTKDYHDTLEMLVSQGKFYNAGNHDTCYRDSLDSFLSTAYFKVYNECWVHVPEEHRQPPILSNVDLSLVDLFGPVFQYVVIKRKQIEDEKLSNHGYLDSLVSAKVITPNLLTFDSVK